MMTRHMHKLVESVDEEAPVRFVSISVDPRRDTPEVLRSYAERAGPDPKWLFVTGDPKTIVDVSRNGFKLAADSEIEPGTEALLHSTKFVLADRKGRIRGYYEAASSQERSQLQSDLKSLILERG